MSRRKSSIVTVWIAAAATLGCAKNPEKAFEQFLNEDRPGPWEEEIVPLVLAGDDVVPLVIQHIRDSSAVRRSMAIRFLGNGGYRDALPTLRTILEDRREPRYHRVEALIAIYRIDQDEGITLARQAIRNGDDALTLCSRTILEDPQSLPDHISYIAALFVEWFEE
jgi:hypothetical protein